MEEYLEPFIEELLHINEGAKNKLIDLNAGNRSTTYYLSQPTHDNVAAYALRVINDKRGKSGNTVLRGSALTGAENEQIVGRNVNAFEWVSGENIKDVPALDSFIQTAYKELNLKGNNPLFLSVGALKWKVSVSRDDVREVLSPLLIFPIRLIRTGPTSPVYIEFVDDDVYFNPCLIHKLRQMFEPGVAANFPHPNGVGMFDDPVDLEKLGEGVEYFAAVSAYAESSKRDQDTVFDFDQNVIAIAQYNHNDICMYYDIKRNRDKIYASPLVKRIFTENQPGEKAEIKIAPDLVLPYDSAQEEMIGRVVNGESLIIKGPPGTGKTLTIANMIAALLSCGKKVLLASQKLSALGEVNAKLPEPLRKFVMLMDVETEAQTAKMSPSAVRRQFKSMLQSREKYSFDKQNEHARDAANRTRSAAIAMLSKYYSEMFKGEAAVSVSYYDALNIFLKKDLPLVEFMKPEHACVLSAQAYNELARLVREAGGYFEELTASGEHPIAKSPWYGVHGGVDLDGAIAEYSAIAAKAKTLPATVAPPFAAKIAALNDFYIYDIAVLMSSALKKDELDRVLDSEDKFAAMLRALDEYEELAPHERATENCDLAAAERELKTLDAAPVLNGLSIGDVRLLADNIDILQGSGDAPIKEETLENMLKILGDVEKNAKERDEHIFNAGKVFEETVCRDNFARIVEAGDALSRYFESGEKPGLFDFSAKKEIKELRPLSYLKDASFREIVDAVKEICLAKACDDRAENLTGVLTRALRKQIDAADLESLVAVKRLVDKGMSFESIVCGLAAYGDTVKALAAASGLSKKELAKMTVRELKLAVKACLALDELKRRVKTAREKLKIEGEGGEVRFAETVLAARRMFSFETFKHDSAEERYGLLERMQNADDGIKVALNAFVDRLRAFGKKYFDSHFTRVRNVTVAELNILANEAMNRDLLSAALNYGRIVNNDLCPVSLAAFFAKFEEGTVKGNIPDIFEHSFYGLAVEGVMRRMGAEKRNGLGKRVEKALEDLAAADKKLQKATAAIVERKCMQRIDPDDRDFAFVDAERDPAATLRSLFKNFPSAILKLKKCFIMTPSTASVLFRPDEYSDFDVVIVDEASQLEPVNLLPVLFRSKQCVIVGDEWQMPPIKHFVTQYERRIVDADGTERFVLEPELSALTLALRNRAFNAEELLCHYRSKTESLISYSQQLFYPHMRTFPAPLPKDVGLGFKDVFVNGYCDGGVNEVEAVKVVELLKMHFDEYYDEESGVLKQSVGVVAFGEKQIEEIKRRVDRDAELSKMISNALSNFDDVPEKLIFFKTIETVQGQETAHLILSLTYGKTKEGKVSNAFGQLNRDRLGQCIFNVAVTRAQSSVTLVHSVYGREITGANVSYIRDYLLKAEQFDKDGLDQFVSADPGLGFIASVADYIVSLGVERKRIVLGYGVTDGSVRIPIAVLSPDYKTAQLGIWCETPTKKNYNYLDYNMRYYDILENRGWKLFRVFAHEWVNNAEAERKNLAEVIKKYITM